MATLKQLAVDYVAVYTSTLLPAVPKLTVAFAFIASAGINLQNGDMNAAGIDLESAADSFDDYAVDIDLGFEKLRDFMQYIVDNDMVDLTDEEIWRATKRFTAGIEKT